MQGFKGEMDTKEKPYLLDENLRSENLKIILIIVVLTLILLGLMGHRYDYLINVAKEESLNKEVVE